MMKRYLDYILRMKGYNEIGEYAVTIFLYNVATTQKNIIEDMKYSWITNW